MLHSIATNLFIFYLFFKLYSCKKSVHESFEPFSSTLCRMYKGCFSILIFLHHASMMLPENKLLQYMHPIGYLSTGGFFFLSGYGLLKSYDIKGDTYSSGFLKKRFLTLFPVYFIMFCIYIYLYKFCGQTIRFDLLKTGKTIVVFGWYVWSIGLYYLLFKVFLKLKLSKQKILFGTIIYVCCYVYILRKLNFDYWWFVSIHMICFGMFWEIYEDKLITVFKSYKKIMMPCMILIFLVTLFCCPSYVWNNSGRYIDYVIRTIFVMVLFLFWIVSNKLTGKWLEKFSIVSYEFYLAHGFALAVIPASFFLYLPTAFIFSYIFAVSLHKITNMITQKTYCKML